MNGLIGAIIIYRQEVRPFTDKQIELVAELRRPGRHRHREHAAAQRIAQRTDDLAESLEQQTATSEVLECHLKLAGRTWSRYFEAILENATRICEAKFGTLNPLRWQRVPHAARAMSARPRNLPNFMGSVDRFNPHREAVLPGRARQSR